MKTFKMRNWILVYSENKKYLFFQIYKRKRDEGAVFYVLWKELTTRNLTEINFQKLSKYKNKSENTLQIHLFK